MTDASLQAAKIVGALDHYLDARQGSGHSGQEESLIQAIDRHLRNKAEAHDQLVAALAEALKSDG